MGKLVITLIETFEITGIAVLDILLFTIINSIAFTFAFKTTGLLKEYLDYDSKKMKAVHWCLRILFTIGTILLLQWGFKQIIPHK